MADCSNPAAWLEYMADRIAHSAVPSLGVSVWLSYLLHIPYSILVVSLSVGQIISGICGTFLVHIIERAYTFHQEGI